jgi:hypothetical protein
LTRQYYDDHAGDDMGKAGRTQNWNPSSTSENVIERGPFEGIGIDERMGLKWVIKGRIQMSELDSPV